MNTRAIHPTHAAAIAAAIALACISAHGSEYVPPDRTQFMDPWQAGEAAKWEAARVDGAAAQYERPHLLAGPPPAGDAFDSPLVIATTPGSVTSSTANATAEEGEPHLHLRFGVLSVWAVWTCPLSGNYGIDTRNAVGDTILSVYTGATLSDLSRIAFNDDDGLSLRSYVFFAATAGTTYRIAVGSFSPTGTGVFTLAVYPDAIFAGTTNRNNAVFNQFSPGGLYLRSSFTNAVASINFTNSLGKRATTVPAVIAEFQHSFELRDPRGNVLFSNLQIPDLSSAFSFPVFDGKRLVLFDRLTQTLFLYDVSANGISKRAEMPAPRISMVQLIPGRVVATLLDPDSRHQGTQVLDRNLRRTLWEMPLAEWEPVNAQQFGMSSRILRGDVAFAYSNALSKTVVFALKRGRLYAAHNLPFSRFPSVLVDGRGGVLYWLPQGVTNGPITYEDRRGRTLVDNQLMPGVGAAWFGLASERSTFYLRQFVALGTNVVHSISLGRDGLTHVAAVPGSALLVDGRSRFIQASSLIGITNAFAVAQYNPLLTREVWNSPPTPATTLQYLGKGTFVIGDGGVPFLTFTVFNRRGIVATHTP